VIEAVARAFTDLFLNFTVRRGLQEMGKVAFTNWTGAGRTESAGQVCRRVPKTGAHLPLVLLAIISTTSIELAAAPVSELVLGGGPATIHRLTQEQYRNTIMDVFGPVSLGGRFEPDARTNHLIAVGTSQTTVTAAGLEEFDHMALAIAGQVVDPQHRGRLIPCKPVSPAAADEICARQFLGRVGRLLFRRPMTAAELSDFAAIATEGVMHSNDFYFGLQLALAGLLEAPQFLFRQEQVEPDPAQPGTYRLTPNSMASRLSFLIWNSIPDQELLDAADRGDLRSPNGLARQVDRMLASPRLELGVRAFFSDMLNLDGFDVLAKDSQLYPNYSRDVARQAQEQTLRTIVDLLIKRDGDYRDLFTTSRTFVTPLLASLYQLPVSSQYTLPWQWQAVDLPVDRPQAGILTQIGFVALHSHPGKTSPTLRGKALRELVMCQTVPDPPANVSFEKFSNADPKQTPTVRDRLNEHVANPICAGCHKIMDPVGLALENYDTVGAFRLTDNDAPIDASGVIDRVTYKDANGLGKALHDSPQTSSCLVQRIYSYGVGRETTAGEKVWLKQVLEKRFAADGYRVPQLLRRIALDPGFYRVTPT
jgi:hypothetical protein